MNRVHYNISGIQNSEMKTQLKNALEKLDGISMVNVDVARESIEIGYRDSTDENSIKSCIENVGCNIISQADR